MMKNRFQALCDAITEKSIIVRERWGKYLNFPIKLNSKIESILFGDDAVNGKEYDTLPHSSTATLLEDESIEMQQCSVVSRRGTCYDQILENARKELRSKELYLQPITLQELSNRIYTNRNYLSYAIRNITGKSYKEFINDFRFEYAISLYENDNGMTLQDIAILSGFSGTKSFSSALRSSNNQALNPLKKRYLCKK